MGKTRRKLRLSNYAPRKYGNFDRSGTKVLFFLAGPAFYQGETLIFLFARVRSFLLRGNHKYYTTDR